MRLGENGCYRVSPREACSRNCGLCEAVCPFADTGHNEDSIGEALYAGQSGIGHRPECGYYLSSHVGCCSDEKRRLNGASGGVATAFLSRLISEGDVQKVVCVTRDPGSPSLFRSSIAASDSDLDKAAKSAYYPVEFSAAIREILAVPGKYAIVCLPCVAKAVRLAQMRIPALKERIAVVAGLVCGHSVSSCFADYVGALAGARVGSVDEIVFRTKSPELPTSDFGTLVRWRNAQGVAEENTVRWNDGVSEAWCGHWFTPQACFYCDDAFAECADVVFMDAWLPEFAGDCKGTSLILTRSQRAKAVVGEMDLASIGLDQVLASQGAVVEFKRQRLAHRLWRASKTRLAVPAKRVAPRKAEEWYSAMAWDAEVTRAAVGPVMLGGCGDLHEFQVAMRGITGDLPTSIRARRFCRAVLDRVRRGGGTTAHGQ